MFRRFFTTLLTGLLALLPLVITIALIAYVAGFLARSLGPGSGFGQLLSRLTGGREDLLPLGAAYLASIALIVGVLWIVGTATRSYLAQRLAKQAEHVIARIPLVNTIYSSIDQIVDLLKKKEGGSSVEGTVLFRMANTLMLGFLSCPEPINVDGVAHYMVYAPNSPVPSGGFTYMVPRADLIRINLSTEEATRIIVSLGATSAAIMNAKQPLEAGDGLAPTQAAG